MTAVRQLQVKAGLVNRPGPVIARHVPVQFIPFREAAEMVADLIADLIVLDTRFQEPFAAANTDGY